jgi:hypothetical protein
MVQDAAETFATRNRRSRIGVLVGCHRDRRDQPIVQSLVIAFEVVVLDELRDREAKVASQTRWRMPNDSSRHGRPAILASPSYLSMDMGKLIADRSGGEFDELLRSGPSAVEDLYVSLIIDEGPT